MICLHLNKWRAIFTSELHKRNSSKQQVMLIRGGGREIDIMVPYNDYNNNIMCVWSGPRGHLSQQQNRPETSIQQLYDRILMIAAAAISTAGIL